MAQKVHIVLEDDLDGSPATETVSFGLDGKTYEIDLNDKNAGKLRDALAQYVGAGRSVGGGRRGGRKSASSATNLGPSAREVRDWARTASNEMSRLSSALAATPSPSWMRPSRMCSVPM